MRTVRSRLSFLAGLLALVAAGLAAERALGDLRGAEAAKRTALVAEGSQAMLAAAAAWAVERGTGNGLLANPAAATPAQRAALSEARQRGEAEFARGLAALRRLDSPAIAEAAARAEERRQRVQALRGEMDGALAVGGAVPPALRAAWFPAMNELIMAAGQDLGLAARATLGDAGAPGAIRGLDLARALWEASEFAGRERGTANAILAQGRAMTAAELRALGEVRGHVLSAWAAVMPLSGALGPEVRDRILAARAAYFAPGLETLRDSVLRAGDPGLAVPAGGARYPVVAAEWFRATTEAMAPTLVVQQAAAEGLRSAAAEARGARLVGAALSLTLLALTIALGLVGAWFVMRRVSRPLADIAAAMDRLAAGDPNVSAEGASRRDEIGALARAFECFRNAAAERARLAAEALAQAEARQARTARIEAMVRSFEAEAGQALRALAAASAELDATAGELAGSARYGSERAEALRSSTVEAAANVRTVAASTEELSASIAEVAARVAESAATARRASESARSTDATMGGLSDAASRIGDVVRLIGDIAAQTNLLALNATIEAARAGEAGKGFAVVASEVKQLAAQTASATEEIAGQITAMQAETSRAVAAIKGIGDTIEAMNSLSGSVAAAAEEQSAATREITRAVAEAASGTGEVSRHAGDLGSDATRTGAAAAQLRGASAGLTRQAERLRAQMDGFLDGLRAA
jgi:methyl-accepting chemotaxis protein